MDLSPRCSASRPPPEDSLGGGEYLPASEGIQDEPSSEFSDLTEAVSKVFVSAPGGLCASREPWPASSRFLEVPAAAPSALLPPAAGSGGSLGGGFLSDMSASTLNGRLDTLTLWCSSAPAAAPSSSEEKTSLALCGEAMAVRGAGAARRVRRAGPAAPLFPLWGSPPLSSLAERGSRPANQSAPALPRDVKRGGFSLAERWRGGGPSRRRSRGVPGPPPPPPPPVPVPINDTGLMTQAARRGAVQGCNHSRARGKKKKKTTPTR